MEQSFKDNPVSAVVYVDRTIRPVYPNGMLKVYRKKENRPSKFNVQSLKKMPYQRQNKSFCIGSCNYEFLRDNGLRGVCLDVYDLMAIQKKGVIFFRKYFHWESVIGMGSVVRIGYEVSRPPNQYDLQAPCIYVNDSKVELRWFWLNIRESWPITWGIWRHK